MDPFEFQSPQHHWHQYPYQQQPFYQPMPQRRGLNQIVHKLLGKGHSPYGRIPQAPFMTGPGMTSKYAQLYETLNHVQKGLGIIQQVSPYIKQYGPFVKNLPMFVDMVKIMMENEDEEDDTHKDDDHYSEQDVKTDLEHQDKETDKKSNVENIENRRRVNPKVKKKSAKSEKDELPKPKLYI